MDRWQAMRIFVEVADGGGFAAAARALNISPPAVTRAVAALEAAIGARLLVRTTRSVKLTEAGRRYVDDCRRILADIEQAEAEAAGSFARPAGTLTVTAPVLFGRIYVLPAILDFLDAFPDVRVRTLFLDRITHLVDEGIDVAVRIGHLPDSSLRATRVGQVRGVVCGAPAYFQTHGLPRTPADLARHRLIDRVGMFGGGEWRFGSGEGAVKVDSRLQCNTNDAAIEAAAAGWGLSRFLSYQVGPDLASGRLQAVLVAHEEAPVPIHIVHAEGLAVSAKVRAFVDFVAGRLRADRVLNP